MQETPELDTSTLPQEPAAEPAPLTHPRILRPGGGVARRKIDRRFLYRIIQAQQARLNYCFQVIAVQKQALDVKVREGLMMEQRINELVSQSWKWQKQPGVLSRAWRRLTAASIIIILAVAVVGCVSTLPRANPWAEPPGYAQSGPNPLEGPVAPRKAYPHPLNPDDPIIRCSGNITITEASVVAEELMPNGLLARVVDARTKAGRKIIIIAMYPVTTSVYDRATGTLDYKTAKYAVLYAVDLDLDRRYDEIYHDRKGTGECAKIVKEEGTKDSKPDATI